jgi:small subunit ribosomal protein S17
MTATESTTSQGQSSGAEASQDRTVRRVLAGTVTSNAMAKTITVEVERTYKHKKYGKYVRKAKRYHAHDEKAEAGKGDRVEIMACRPYSKTKRWRLVRVTEKSRLVDAVTFDTEGQVATAEGQAGTKSQAAASKTQAAATKSQAGAAKSQAGATKSQAAATKEQSS